MNLLSPPPAEKPNWLKSKGYIHLTPSISLKNWKTILEKLENHNYINNYKFFPLIHRVLRERKYKRVDPKENKLIESKLIRDSNGNILKLYNAHKHFNLKKDKVERTRKDRHLYYATHFDSLIYAYYSQLINSLYIKELEKDEILDKSIIAYRKILINENDDDNGPGKSTIHFSKEVFDQIKYNAAKLGEVGVLAFDIKNFFPSMDHNILKTAWVKLVGIDNFEASHNRIFQACTNFRYINYNDLKLIENQRKKGFNESLLNNIRKEKGYKCVFKNYNEFRDSIKYKKLRVYNPNYNKKGIIKGIPQGLPISATLANLYLLEFDKIIIKDLVLGKNSFYRRYSDDIIIICPTKDIRFYEETIMNLIKVFKLEISKHKTDRYIFKYLHDKKRLECFKLDEQYNIKKTDRLIYLGFEFYGYQTLIKSTNLAKYYRRLIKTVERRAKRINNALKNEPTTPKAIFYNQIKKIINKPLKDGLDKAESKVHYKDTINILEKDFATGQFKVKKIIPKVNNENHRRSTYMGYVNRCVSIHGSKTFLHQLRKRKYILNNAIKIKLNKFTS